LIVLEFFNGTRRAGFCIWGGSSATARTAGLIESVDSFNPFFHGNFSMPHKDKSESLSGHLQQLLFSPRGGIEGLLLKVDSKPIQVSLNPEAADANVLNDAVGKPIEVKASADHSPKTKHSAHPVYQLESITKLAGKAFKSNGTQPIRGVVASIHYAKHGEPNGVILESGEFIHTRPHGMKKLKLDVGSRVVAHGEARTTVLGTALIEAHEVNRVTIE
jgi:hypothetical protein